MILSDSSLIDFHTSNISPVTGEIAGGSPDTSEEPLPPSLPDLDSGIKKELGATPKTPRKKNSVQHTESNKNNSQHNESKSKNSPHNNESRNKNSPRQTNSNGRPKGKGSRKALNRDLPLGKRK